MEQTMTLSRVRSARLACAYYFAMAGLAMGTIMTRIPALKQQTGVDESRLGQALLGIGIGAVLAFPLGTLLCRRYGSRIVMTVGTLLMLIGFPLVGLSQDGIQLTVCFFSLGMVFGGLDVAINVHAVEVERLLAKPCMSLLHGMYSLGGLIGALLAALLAVLTPWWHFVSLALAGLLGLAYFARMLLPPNPMSDNDAPPGFRMPPLSLLGLGLLTICSFVAEGSVADWSALLLHDVLSASEQVAALGFAAFSATMVAGRLLGDRLRSAFEEVTLLRGLGAVATLGMSIAILSPWVALSILGFGLAGLGLSVIVPILISAAGNQPGVEPAIGVAAVSSMGYGGLMLGPPLIGMLANTTGLRQALLVSVALCLVILLRAGLVKSGRKTAVH